MARKVIFKPEVVDYLEEVSLKLYDAEYFSFKDKCKEYIDKLFNYSYKYVGILPDKPAPPHFDRYGENMQYIVYHSNKRTSWYIFFQQDAEIYLICYIINNHVAAQYMIND
jgi:hypothetical protein